MSDPKQPGMPSLSRSTSNLSEDSRSEAAVPIDHIDAETREHFNFLRQSLGVPGQNFFSVLNDPSDSRPQQSWGGWVGGGISSMFDRPTDAAPKLSPLPVVTKDHFSQYVAHVGPEFERWRGLRRAAAARRPPDGDSDRGFRSASLDLARKIGSVGAEILDPPTLAAIIPSSDPHDTTAAEACIAQHLAVVEERLFARVKQRSRYFFEAVQNFHRIKGEVTASLQHTHALRGAIAQIEEETVGRAMRSLQLQRRKRNIERARAVGVRVQEVLEVRRRVAELLAADDHSAAAKAIDAATALLDGQLSGISALRGLRQDLEEMRKQAKVETRKHLLQILATEDGAGVEPAAAWRPRIEGPVRSLLSEGASTLHDALKAHQQETADRVKRVVSDSLTEALRTVMSQTGGDADAPRNELLKPSVIQSLNTHQFRFVLEHMFHSVLTLLGRTHAACTALAAIVMDQRPGEPLPLDMQMLVDLVRTTEQNTSTMIQARVVRMFQHRKEEHAGLRFSEIELLMRISFKFIRQLESVFTASGGEGASAPGQGPAASFRATLTSQARDFFKNQHDKQQQKLHQILLHEHWSPNEEIDASFQGFCDRIVDESPQGIRRAEETAVDAAETDRSPSPHPQEPEEQGFAKKVTVGDRRYSVTQSALMLVQILADYERCVCVMPFLSHDIVQRMHELLKFYDGQTAMLLLGAQARETAGIETITARHLCVGSQCLSFLADIAPRLKGRLSRILPPRGQTFLKNLDRFTKEAIEHKNEFYVKIIMIVKESTREMNPDHWRKDGAAWVVEMLTVLRKLLRRGLEEAMEKQQLREVVYPLLYNYHSRLLACVQGIPDLHGNPELLAQVRGDLLTFKVNVEKLGFSVSVASRARDLTNPSAWLPQGGERLPEVEAEVLALYGL